MDWKQLAESVAKLGLPLLGAALPIPGGAALGSALATVIASPSAEPNDILTTLAASADAVLKAKQFEQQYQVAMLSSILTAETSQVEAINKTIQTEATAISWLQRNHHAMESLATVALVWAIYFILPLAKIQVPAVPETAWITLGAILGVTAWMKGQVNVATVKNENNGH